MVQGFSARHIFGFNNYSAVLFGQGETGPNVHCPTTPPLIILGGRRAIAMDRYSEKRPSTTCALVQLSSLSVHFGTCRAISPAVLPGLGSLSAPHACLSLVLRHRRSGRSPARLVKDRKSVRSGTSVSVRVDLVGLSLIKKQKVTDN